MNTKTNLSNFIKKNPDVIEFCKPLSLGSLSVSGALGTLGDKWFYGNAEIPDIAVSSVELPKK